MNIKYLPFPPPLPTPQRTALTKPTPESAPLPAKKSSSTSNPTTKYVLHPQLTSPHPITNHTPSKPNIQNNRTTNAPHPVQVSRIKERVEEKEGIPPVQQRLIFGGKQM